MENETWKNPIRRWVLMVPRRVLRGCIVVYQKTLSPDHGPLAKLHGTPTCRFRPTCSEYGYEAVSRFGVLKGVPMTIWRILRCNPWATGGWDPVPKTEIESHGNSWLVTRD